MFKLVKRYGERLNFVIWMRSSAHRRIAGCPMCGETTRLLMPPASGEAEAMDVSEAERPISTL